MQKYCKRDKIPKQLSVPPRRKGGEQERGEKEGDIERVVMGWMITSCLQGYTLQLYHCRASREGREEGGSDMESPSQGTELKKAEAPSSDSDLHVED